MLLASFIDGRLRRQDNKLKDTPRQSIMEILDTRRGLGATDARDINFGHIGIANLPCNTLRRQNAGDFKLTTPDYEKSISQVFNQFACDMITWSDSFAIFSRVENMDPSQRRKGLASWAPDWAMDPYQYPQPITFRPIVASQH